ncbi:MAG TPA: tetratricopeptide repeat protein, partial [Pyrinomonadaceae bacterium]|nr:tetratricopeptide repeat protein [Pyrinomonadaceae bacterium]
WLVVIVAVYNRPRSYPSVHMKRIVTLLVSFVLLVAVAHGQFFDSGTARKAGEKLNKGDRAGALAILDAAIAKGKDLAEAYELRSNIRMMSGDLRGSVNDLSSAIDLNPTKASLYERRAMQRSFLRDTDGALKDYDLAIANGVRTERIFVGRAQVKRDSGDFDGAISDFQAALSINPNNASANIGLAGLLERTGQKEAAILHLQEFLDRYEGKRDGKLPTVIAGQGTGETVMIKREGREKDGGQVVLAGTATRIEFKAETTEDVEKFTNKREQLMNLSLSYFTLGRLCTLAGELDKALVAIEKGLKINPSDNYGNRLRADIRIKKGDLSGAIADLELAVNSTMILASHADKAVLATLKGDDEAAKREMEVHLHEFPNAREAVERRITEAKAIRTKE